MMLLGSDGVASKPFSFANLVTMTTGNNDEQKKKKLFYTTSDMMKTINKSIACLDSSDDAISPRVELQRRMPDGSTRRADERDLEAADMDSKLKQAADQVADLSPKQKIEWAQRQCQEGNLLYKEGDYREALDVYLTCLVAKTEEDDFMTLVFLPVMNNLAQCSLQLGMYRKAETFCTMALEEVDGEPEEESSIQLVAKLFFRRGRAKRLSGEYGKAREDLEISLQMLEDGSAEHRSVQRELQLVKRAEVEERQNEKRQEHAMRCLLGNDATGTGVTKEMNRPEGMDNSQPTIQQSLYQGEDSNRPYSTLTARRRGNESRQAVTKQNFWRWYISMIGRVAEKLLVLLGDGDEEHAGVPTEETCTDRDRRKRE